MERRKNYSKKREAILAYLRSTDAHPTAECVYRQLKPSFPDLSLGNSIPQFVPVQTGGRHRLRLY